MVLLLYAYIHLIQSHYNATEYLQCCMYWSYWDYWDYYYMLLT